MGPSLHTIRISWCGHREHNPPDVLTYLPISRFAEDGPDWIKKPKWSLLLQFETPPSEQGNPSIGFARFFVDDAPHEKLAPGVTFHLYEGPACVAEAEVLDDRQS